jgi:hypothetical protein
MIRVVRRWLAVLVVPACVIAACHSFGSSAGANAELDAGPDVGTADAPDTEPDSSVPGESFDSGLLVGGDFEDAAACTDWGGGLRYEADAAPFAYSGQASCEICQRPEAGTELQDLYLYPHSFGIQNPEAGATYGAVMYVWADIDRTEVDLEFEADYGDGGVTLLNVNNTYLPAHEWKRITTQGLVPSNAQWLYLRLHAQVVGGGCFFIDQAAVGRL